MALGRRARSWVKEGAPLSRRMRSKGEVRLRLGRLLACLAVGALLLALALVVGDADYHASPVGWVPFLMFALLVICARAYLQLLAPSLSFEESADSASCVRDSQVPFRVLFSNRGPLFFLNVKVVFTIKDLFGQPYNTVETTLSLGPRESYEMGFDMRFTHVGRYTAGIERVVVSDFMGLFSKVIVNRTPKTVCVNPKIHTIAQMELSEEALEDSDKASKSVLADSMDYAYVREYVQGDPLKTIHWKLSARTGEYLTRLFEVYTNPGVAVFMDLYAPVDSAEDLMSVYDAVIEAGFSVARYAWEEGMDMAVHYVNRAGEAVKLAGCSADDVAHFVEDAPAVSCDPAVSGVCAELVRRQCSRRYGQNNVVLCSSNFSAQTVEAVLSARSNGRTPLVVAVVPASIVDRDREDYCRPLRQLEAAGVECMVVSHAHEMRGVVG